MKYRLTVLLWVVVNFSSWAQDTLYLNQSWQKVKVFEDTTYMRLMKKTSKGWYVNDFYYPNGVLQMEGEVLSFNPLILEGYCVYYYRNGNKEKEGEYNEGRPLGVHKEYYSSGQIKSEIEYQDEGQYVHQIWSEEGKELLEEGNGEYESINSDGNEVYQKINDHYVVLSYTVRPQQQDTLYTITEQAAEYPGGLEKFYRSVQKKIKYPKGARRAGIQGVVYVYFEVNTTGAVANIKVLKGIGGGCDTESKRVIQELKAWKPAEVDNKPVKVCMVLPITFRL